MCRCASGRSRQDSAESVGFGSVVERPHRVDTVQRGEKRCHDDANCRASRANQAATLRAPKPYQSGMACSRRARARAFSVVAVRLLPALGARSPTVARILFVLPVVLFSAATAAAQVAAPVKPVWPDEGPMTWAPRPTTRDITATDLRTRLYGFSDDSMSGRRVESRATTRHRLSRASRALRTGRPATGTYFRNAIRSVISTARMVPLITMPARRDDQDGLDSDHPQHDERIERQGEHRQRADGVRRPMGRYRRRARSRCVQGKGRCVRRDGGQCGVDRPRWWWHRCRYATRPACRRRPRRASPSL
jgi:hypothetical protein